GLQSAGARRLTVEDTAALLTQGQSCSGQLLGHLVRALQDRDALAGGAAEKVWRPGVCDPGCGPGRRHRPGNPGVYSQDEVELPDPPRRQPHERLVSVAGPAAFRVR